MKKKPGPWLTAISWELSAGMWGGTLDVRLSLLTWERKEWVGDLKWPLGSQEWVYSAATRFRNCRTGAKGHTWLSPGQTTSGLPWHSILPPWSSGAVSHLSGVETRLDRIRYRQQKQHDGFTEGDLERWKTCGMNLNHPGMTSSLYSVGFMGLCHWNRLVYSLWVLSFRVYPVYMQISLR